MSSDQTIFQLNQAFENGDGDAFRLIYQQYLSNAFDECCDDIDRLKILIQSGLNVNYQDNFGFTPLMLAARKFNSHIVSWLLDNGADVNKKDSDGITAIGHLLNYHMHDTAGEYFKNHKAEKIIVLFLTHQVDLSARSLISEKTDYERIMKSRIGDKVKAEVESYYEHQKLVSNIQIEKTEPTFAF